MRAVFISGLTAAGAPGAAGAAGVAAGLSFFSWACARDPRPSRPLKAIAPTQCSLVTLISFALSVSCLTVRELIRSLLSLIYGKGICYDYTEPGLEIK